MTDQQAAAVIRQSVKELETHPRFKGRQFGPSGALELLYQLYQYLEAHPGTRWPAVTEGSDDAQP